MKKVLSVFISTVMIFLTFSSVSSAEKKDDKLCFAVASDLHYNAPRENLTHDIDDPVFWYANRRCAMEDESGFIIDEFLNECAQNKDCRFVLIPGDLADNGRTIIEDHYTVASKFRNFEKKTGKQIFVINGNHDASTGNDTETSYEDFKRIYAEFGYDEAVSEPRSDCSYAANLGEKYRLIALDSNDGTKSTEDGMNAEKLSWVKEQVKSAKDDNRYPILMMHHNLLDHLPVQRVLSRNFIVRFHYSTAEFFADLGIRIVLTGHEHCSDVTSYTSLIGNKIYDFATTSLTMYPLSYRLFELKDDEIKYSERKISSFDYMALKSVSPDFTDEQISLMSFDLDTYSKSFLKTGVKYRLQLSLSKNKASVDENALYYNVVCTAIDGLLNLLEMPLYGPESLSELAMSYDIMIPKTEYLNGWDLATDLVAWHYSGGEQFDLTSDEVQTLLKAVVVILRSDFADIADSLILIKAANYLLSYFGVDSVSDALTYLGIDVFGPVSPCEYVIMALISPLIYEFAFDSDGVDDNNGVIEGYESVGVYGNILNVSDNIIFATGKISLYLNNIYGFLLKAVGSLLRVL